jgi:hypothetical protein
LDPVFGVYRSYDLYVDLYQRMVLASTAFLPHLPGEGFTGNVNSSYRALGAIGFTSLHCSNVLAL